MAGGELNKPVVAGSRVTGKVSRLRGLWVSTGTALREGCIRHTPLKDLPPNFPPRISRGAVQVAMAREVEHQLLERPKIDILPYGVLDILDEHGTPPPRRVCPLQRRSSATSEAPQTQVYPLRCPRRTHKARQGRTGALLQSWRRFGEIWSEWGKGQPCQTSRGATSRARSCCGRCGGTAATG